MQIKQDKYNSIQSKIVKIDSKGADISLDLTLSFNTTKPNIGTSIVGKVVDTNNIPIQGAVVKLMDGTLQSLSNAITDSNGNYSINLVPFSNIYNMTATAQGKTLSQVNPFTLASSQSEVINFILKTDLNSTLGAVSGILKDINSNIISGAIVLLYSVINGNNALLAITYTDSLGVFVFSELNEGSYNIVITALGYIQGQVITNVKGGGITRVSKVLYDDPKAANGIISGIITDITKNPIVSADVILYSVTSNNILTPKGYTTTNSAGIYTFINVPSGDYLIKSNQSKLVTVNAATMPTNIIS